MMKFFPILLIATLTFNMSAKKSFGQSKPQNNPLLEKSNLQYQAPRFDLIKDEHFEPAFEYAIKIHDAELDKIINSKEAPTFENTVLALEKSGEDLNRATSIFYNLTGSNTNDKLQKIEEKYAPIFSAHNDKLFLNSKIYQRIKSLSLTQFSGEKAKLISFYLEQFEMAGANLPEDKKQIMKNINQDLATLSTTFSNKLLLARKNASLVFDNANALDGLGKDDLEAAKIAANEAGHKGAYLISIQNTTQQPILKYLKNRATREAIFNASWTRAEKNDAADTRDIIMQMTALRLQKAQLMGAKNFAAWKLSDQVAKNTENAMKLLAELAKPAVAKAKQEASEIQKLIDAQKGGFQLKPWDWDFYGEQVRKAKYDIDENMIKPYFELKTVLEKGVFYAAEKMYGISFKVRKDLPLYHPDVVAYEVFDINGQSMAIYYLDFYTRDNKNGGAWMNNFVTQSHVLNQKPVIVNVFNFQKPAPGKPSLISYDDVTTMFHEFGHTLHGLFANQDYPSLSGTSVPRDFVEFPSQINEHCALDPMILKNYAIHYQTKQVIPQELI
ncbi:MAG: M3 family metallopeptidase, partial [Chitinophagaceae bacterium]|nr:M3 family metallopeptidase [Chitinophagaceae bacterium]